MSTKELNCVTRQTVKKKVNYDLKQIHKQSVQTKKEFIQFRRKLKTVAQDFLSHKLI